MADREKQASDEEVVQITPKEFRQEIYNVANRLESFFKVIFKAIPNDIRLKRETEAGSVSLYKKDFKELGATLIKDTKDLGKKYLDSKKRTRNSTTSNNAGFSRPSYIIDAMKNFLKEADFGKAYEELEDGTFRPLNKNLKDLLHHTITNSVTTKGILVSLFSILRRLNLNIKDNNKKMLEPTLLMKKHLLPILEEIEREDVEAMKKMTPEQRKSHVPFTVKGFAMPRQQTIFSKCIHKREELEAEAVAQLDSEEVKAQLELEQKYASGTCHYLASLAQKQK